MLGRRGYLFGLVLLSICIAGCVDSLAIRAVPQSRYIQPDSKLVVLGPTKGEATQNIWTVGGVPDITHGEFVDEALQAALQAKGADALIDYTVSYFIFKWPIPQIIFSYNYWDITCTVEGTAVQIQGENR